VRRVVVWLRWWIDPPRGRYDARRPDWLTRWDRKAFRVRVASLSMVLLLSLVWFPVALWMRLGVVLVCGGPYVVMEVRAGCWRRRHLVRKPQRPRPREPAGGEFEDQRAVAGRSR
jgi:hypothetical protein